MVADPAFARWVIGGERGVGESLPAEDTEAAGTEAAGTEAARFAAFERTVMRRTNSTVGPAGRLQLPWPPRLGTPPWGALAELEHGAAVSGTRYQLWVCRLGSEGRLRRVHARLADRVAQGRPALLYIGSRSLPRHVTLVLSSGSGRGLDLYDPATGAVTALDPEDFARRRLRVAGWDVPWCLVVPRRSVREPM